MEYFYLKNIIFTYISDKRRYPIILGIYGPGQQHMVPPTQPRLSGPDEDDSSIQEETTGSQHVTGGGHRPYDQVDRPQVSTVHRRA